VPFTLIWLFQLSAVNAEEREVACKSLAGCLVDEPEAALDFVLTHGAVPTLLARLVDHAPEVAVAACGCLRNAVLVGDAVFVAHVVALNGVTPLLAAVPRAHAAALAALDDAARAVQLDLLAELVALVGYLCEFSDAVARQLASARDFLALLLAYVVDEPLALASAGVPIAAAQFLYTLIDDNDSCSAILVDLCPDLAETLVARIHAACAAQHQQLLLATLLAGLLYSIALQRGAPFEPVLEAISAPIDSALQLNTAASFAAIVAALAPLVDAAGPDVAPDEWITATMSPAVRAQLWQWRGAMNAVRTAITLWTNVIGEASDSVADVSELSDSLRGRAQAWLGALLVRCSVPPSVGELLAAHPYLASPLLDLEIDNFGFIQLLAVRAVNNTLFVLGIDQLGREPQRVWDFCVRLALKSAAGTAASGEESALATQLDAYVLCSASTAVLWTLLRAEHAQQQSPRVVASGEQLAALREILSVDPTNVPAELVGDEADEVSSLVSLLTNVVGTLGTLGARAVPDVEHAVATAQALARLLTLFGSDGALVAEVLNALMDCFAEDDYNEALKPFRFVDSLRSFAPHVQQLVQAAANAHDDRLAERLQETLENTLAFIEYKATR
jgi:hypothetical protein